MKVSKADHITCEYTVVVGKGSVIQDVKLYRIGDVTLDGMINLDDVVTLLRHVSKAVVLTDENSIAAGNIIDNGTLNLDDVVKLLRYVSKAIPSLR